jgi:hypothetical protein
LFSLLFALRSFSFHYQQPSLTRLIAGLGLVAIVGGGILAAGGGARGEKPETDARIFGREASSSSLGGSRDARPRAGGIFIFATCLLAWVLAVVGGDVNFYKNMQPFYDILNLATYPAVDPSQTPGQQVMDAGRIVFTPSATLDLNKAMGFKNLDTYCVAPITVGNSSAGLTPLAAYDFWAVGINCCSGDQGDFHCGEFNNRHAHAGLRLLREDQRAFFRLAVQQAEASLGIKAEHPIFLHWLEDPSTEVIAYHQRGLQTFYGGMLGHFILQVLLVTVSASCVFKAT